MWLTCSQRRSPAQRQHTVIDSTTCIEWKLNKTWEGACLWKGHFVHERIREFVVCHAANQDPLRVHQREGRGHLPRPRRERARRAEQQVQPCCHSVHDVYRGAWPQESVRLQSCTCSEFCAWHKHKQGAYAAYPARKGAPRYHLQPRPWTAAGNLASCQTCSQQGRRAPSLSVCQQTASSMLPCGPLQHVEHYGNAIRHAKHRA